MAANTLVFPTEDSSLTEWQHAAHNAGWEIQYYPTLITHSLTDSAGDHSEQNEELDAALKSAAQTDTTHVLLASPAAVQALANSLKQLGAPHTASPVAVLGLATAASLASAAPESIGILSDAPVYDGLTDGENALMQQIPVHHQLILPVAQEAHEPLVRDLEQLGYEVRAVPAYARFTAQGGDPVGKWLFQGNVDAIFFPSPEHFRFFRRRLLNEGGVMSMLDHVQVYCLDAWTASVAAQFGVSVSGIIGSLEPDAFAIILRQAREKLA